MTDFFQPFTMDEIAAILSPSPSPIGEATSGVMDPEATAEPKDDEQPKCSSTKRRRRRIKKTFLTKPSAKPMKMYEIDPAVEGDKTKRRKIAKARNCKEFQERRRSSAFIDVEKWREGYEVVKTFKSVLVDLKEGRATKAQYEEVFAEGWKKLAALGLKE